MHGGFGAGASEKGWQQYLAGVLCYKKLGEALEGLLARHLAAHRSSLTQESSATPLSSAQPAQPPKLSPKEAQQKQAKREERLARYQPRRDLAQTGLLADGRGFPGWDRSCHGLALVGEWRVSPTTTAPAKNLS